MSAVGSSSAKSRQKVANVKAAAKAALRSFAAGSMLGCCNMKVQQTIAPHMRSKTHKNHGLILLSSAEKFTTCNTERTHRTHEKSDGTMVDGWEWRGRGREWKRVEERRRERKRGKDQKQHVAKGNAQAKRGKDAPSPACRWGTLPLLDLKERDVSVGGGGKERRAVGEGAPCCFAPRLSEVGSWSMKTKREMTNRGSIVRTAMLKPRCMPLQHTHPLPPTTKTPSWQFSHRSSTPVKGTKRAVEDSIATERSVFSSTSDCAMFLV
jgi:hypothetical protein